MKISLVTPSSEWPQGFKKIQSELLKVLASFRPKIEHIGSTAVEALSAKPIIDILVGIKKDDRLDDLVHPLIDNKYIYYERYNLQMPYRRFFVKHKDGYVNPTIPKIISAYDEIPSDTEEHSMRLAHIHIVTYNSHHWIRHIAFRDYLRKNPRARSTYQSIKEALSLKEWSNANAYNEAKDAFMKATEQKAIAWYNSVEKENRL